MPSNSNLEVLTTWRKSTGVDGRRIRPYSKEKGAFIKQDEIRKPGWKVFTPVNTNIKVLKDYKVDLGGEEY